MSSVFNKISEIHRPSFESVIAQADDEIDQHPIDAAVSEIASLQEEIADHSRAAGAVENLVQGTLDTYKDTGMDEQAAELYKISVESVLRMSGIDVPVEAFVPAFEAGMSRKDYSAEAEEKSKGILKRIWDWIVNAFKRFGAMMTRLKNRLLGRTEAMKKKADHVAAEAEKQKDAPYESFKIKLSESEQKSLSAINYVLKQSTVTEFEDALAGLWKKCIDISNGRVSLVLADSAKIKEVNKSIASAIAALKSNKLGRAYTLSITAGPKVETPASGAVVELVFDGELRPEIDSIHPRDALDISAWIKSAGKIVPEAMGKLIELCEVSKIHYSDNMANAVEKNTDEFIEYARHVVAAISLEILCTNKLMPLLVDFCQNCLNVAERSLVKPSKSGDA